VINAAAGGQLDRAKMAQIYVATASLRLTSGVALEDSVLGNNAYLNRTALSEVFAEGHNPITRVVSKGRCNTGLQSIRWSVKSQRFSWALI
jgi:hypothetical protein